MTLSSELMPAYMRLERLTPPKHSSAHQIDGMWAAEAEAEFEE